MIVFIIKIWSGREDLNLSSPCFRDFPHTSKYYLIPLYASLSTVFAFSGKWRQTVSGGVGLAHF